MRKQKGKFLYRWSGKSVHGELSDDIPLGSLGMVHHFLRVIGKKNATPSRHYVSSYFSKAKKKAKALLNNRYWLHLPRWSIPLTFPPTDRDNTCTKEPVVIRKNSSTEISRSARTEFRDEAWPSYRGRVRRMVSWNASYTPPSLDRF